MAPPERRALLLLLALAVAGQGVRFLLTQPGEAPGGVQLLSTLGAASPTAQRDSAMRQGRPLVPGEQIDPDRAAAGELARLPQVGPRLARTIVADRESHGPFGSLAGLDRVPGVGPGLLKRIGPHVSFSGAAAPGAGGQQDSGAVAAPLNINTATLAELDGLPGIGPAKAKAIIRYREEHGVFGTIDALAGVPGISRTVLAGLRETAVAR